MDDVKRILIFVNLLPTLQYFVKKCLESQTGAGNLKTLKTWQFENFENINFGYKE